MDPEALVQCPYDKSHQVRASRLPYHIVKCQRNHPQVARMLATCPFNARHRVPQANLRSHIASCPDKHLPDLPHEPPRARRTGRLSWRTWRTPPPFIFNIGMNDLLLPCDSADPGQPPLRHGPGPGPGPPRAAPGPGRCCRRRRCCCCRCCSRRCPSLPSTWRRRGPSPSAGPPGPSSASRWTFTCPSPAASASWWVPPRPTRASPMSPRGGAVYHCPWPPGDDCTPIDFDHLGPRTHDFGGNSTETPRPRRVQVPAVVRGHRAGAQRLHPGLRPTVQLEPPQGGGGGGGREPVGTCFLSIGNFSKFVEYAPCRSDLNSAAGQGYCQGGFSAEFTQTGRVLLGGPGSYFWQGQVMSATQEQIAASNYPEYLIQEVAGQLQTRQAAPTYDDSYMGYSVAVGEFSGDTTQGGLCGWCPQGQPHLRLRHHPQWHQHEVPVQLLRGADGSVFRLRCGSHGREQRRTGRSAGGGPPLHGADRGGAGAGGGQGVPVPAAARGGPCPPPPRPPPPPSWPPPPPWPSPGPRSSGVSAAPSPPWVTLTWTASTTWRWGPPWAPRAGRGWCTSTAGGGAGLHPQPAQVLRGHWAPGRHPDFFGAALRGATDLDGNGYPDLLVGAFGVDTAVVYRGRPIVHASAALSVFPTMFNPEERGCVLEGTGLHVPCINVSFCLNASGRHLPGTIGFAPTRTLTLPVPNGAGTRCRTLAAFLRNESEFRDKLSPIAVALSFALDPRAPPDTHGLHPVLAAHTRTRLEAKAHIQLDCGEDNVCVPDLQLEAAVDRRAVYLGDRNSLNLTFNARNQGEGGAYEAELHVRPPPPRPVHRGAAPTREFLSAELPVPASGGGCASPSPTSATSSKSIRFELQIRSKNANNSQSEVVTVPLEVRAATRLSAFGVSRPDVVIVPEGGWTPERPPQRRQDLGPPVEHVYEVVNEGPSAISHGTPGAELSPELPGPTPSSMSPATRDPRNCSASHPLDSLRLAEQEQSPEPHVLQRRDTGDTVTRDTRDTRGSGPPAPPHTLGCPEAECFRLSCPMGGLEKQQRVSLRLTFRLWAPSLRQALRCEAEYRVLRLPYRVRPQHYPSQRLQVVTGLQWARAEGSPGVPVWVVVLAVLLGLLGFFKRSGPYGTAMEKAQLKPQAASEA
ncbi:unnamed protein product [Bubo scandiacus]